MHVGDLHGGNLMAADDGTLAGSKVVRLLRLLLLMCSLLPLQTMGRLQVPTPPLINVFPL
jgi:hypothetical protein